MKGLSAPVLGLRCIAARAAEIRLPVPRDSKAAYFRLEKGEKPGESTLLTKRVGPSGTSYARNVFNCAAGTTKYLGTGDTLEDLKASKSESTPYTLVERSVAWYQAQYACRK